MNFKFFLGSVLVAAIASLTIFYLKRPRETHVQPILLSLSDGVFVTSQLSPKDVGSFTNQSIKTVIDLRPDGEAVGQPSSSDIKDAAEKNGMRFHYIPVPHETIPDAAVNELTKMLSEEPHPTLLYCRTGRRAVRTFALAEASRATGPNCDVILQMVLHAGFSGDDLRDEILRRIASRKALEK